MIRILLALVLGVGTLAADTIFDVQSATFQATGSPVFVGSRDTLQTSAFPEVNGVVGFKMFGTFTAVNNGFEDCTTCEISALAGGVIRVGERSEALYEGDIRVDWQFRVDELAVQSAPPGGIEDGTSNTIIIGEQPSSGSGGDLQDGTSNTIFLSELPPTRQRSPQDGGIQDGTSNTILFGEGTPLEFRDFIYRLVIFYGTLPGDIQDGTSNTILLGESQSAQIAAGNGYFGDEIGGTATFAFQPLLGPFTLGLYIAPVKVGIDRAIRLSIPEDSIDLNPPPAIPEPATYALMLLGLAALGIARRTAGSVRP
jgi:hypothetical protein